MMHDFVHLRCSTSYFIGKSSLKVKRLAELCIENNMPAVCIVDNNLFAACEASLALSSKGIQPILGLELPVTIEGIIGNVVLMCQNREGYENLLKLHNLAEQNKFTTKDNIKSVTLESVLNHKEGIILLTGGVGGILDALSAKKDKLELVLKDLNTHFKDKLYIELNRQFTHHDKKLEEILLHYALEYNIPTVATNAVKFEDESYYEATEILNCISNSVVKDSQDHTNKINSESYFKSQSSMVELFKDIPEAISNTISIAKQCLFFLKPQDPMLPKYSDDEDSLIVSLSEQGLQKKIDQISYISSNEDAIKEYKERLSFEIEVIKKMGFSGYFLIVSDFIRWAKENDIPVGPGRGSGAGSLVAWVLEITDVDPLKFGLLFERFLNPERVSMPDFDIDFCNNRREEVINYVKDKYGSEKVASIITFGTFQTKAAIKDVGRALGMPYYEVDNLCKKIPHSAPSNPITLKQLYEEEGEVKSELDRSSQLQYLFQIAMKIEGCYRNVSTHAAGIVIAPDNLNKTAPLFYDTAESMPSVGFSMKYIEAIGLIKFDFLALRTLTIIKDTLNEIKRNHSKDLDILNIDFENQDISKLLSSGNVLGVFQLESRGMIEVIKHLQPDKIEDIIAIISLYRPGPMENIPMYIDRKHGREESLYLHPLMESIINETFGIIIYQEQVMQVAQKLAGYTLGAADILRRAMGKKDANEMQTQKEIFIKGSYSQSNIEEALSGKIFDQIEKFAGYGFNKSHATAYALISWQTAYLKTYYPAEFICCSITSDVLNGNKDNQKLLEFFEEAKAFDIGLLPPCINNPSTKFFIEEVNGKKHIRYSLLAIKGVGKQLVEFCEHEVAKAGKFKSIEDFLSRVDPGYLNKRQIESLILSGAFDTIEKDKNLLLHNLEKLLTYNKSCFEEKNSSQGGLFGEITQEKVVFVTPKETDLLSKKDFLEKELDLLGCFLSNHPLDDFKEVIEANNVSTYNSFLQTKQERGLIAVYLLKIKTSKSKNGGTFANLNFYDKSSTFSLAVFGDVYEKNSQILKEGSSYILHIKSTVDNNKEVRTFIEKIEPLTLKAKYKVKADSKSKNKNITLVVKVVNLSFVEQLKSTLHLGGPDTLMLKAFNGSTYNLYEINNLSITDNSISKIKDLCTQNSNDIILEQVN